MVIIVNFVPEIYSILFYSGTEVVGTEVVGVVHYCIYLVYFACELRPWVSATLCILILHAAGKYCSSTSLNKR